MREIMFNHLRVTAKKSCRHNLLLNYIEAAISYTCVLTYIMFLEIFIKCIC